MARVFVEVDFPRRADDHNCPPRAEKVFIPLELEADLGYPAIRGAGVPVTLRVQRRNCSSPSCSSCPHGPYAYLVVRHPGGRVVQKYLGALPLVTELQRMAAPLGRRGGRKR